MHVTAITNLYPPYIIGGYEVVCSEVVAALRERGHRVSVICGRGTNLPSDRDVHGDLELDLDHLEDTLLGGRLPTPWEAFKLHLLSRASYRATRQRLARLAPDVVAVWNLAMASVAPLVAARRAGIPTTVHLSDKWLYYSLCDLEPLLRPVVRWKRLALRSAHAWLQPLVRRLAEPNHAILVSDFLRDFYLRAGFSASGFQTIHLGVPTASFPSVPRPPSDRAKPLRLLFVGGLWEGKGAQVAIRAVGQLVRSGANVHLDVCGEGVAHFERYLREIRASEGVDAHVTFHGRVGHDAVRAFYQSHDILLFPSCWDEPLAAVPLEAMSSGMAVVATTRGGTPEAIAHEDTGLLVPPNDAEALARAVLRLHGDDALRRDLGRRAARVARQRFDFGAYVDRIERHYREILATGSGLPPRRTV